MDRGEAVRFEKHTIHLQPSGATLHCSDGENLLTVLRREGWAVDAPCGGHGTCGKCRVEVDGTEMLACQTAVHRDLTVLLPQTQEIRILTESRSSDGAVRPMEEGLLAAFDIGTTTVVCFLLDGKTGEELAFSSMLNPQIGYGADVIARIQSALHGSMEEQRKAIADGMDRLIEEACRRAGRDPREIRIVAPVGNPCMQQLFMGILPDNLAKVPFSPKLVRARWVPAGQYLPSCKNAEMMIVPDISGYVGADTMGCILSTGMYQEEKITLMIDIGTNGEMVLGSRNGMVACSTAAGPALEGGKIAFGMRGVTGAIDHVWLEEGRVCCSVIGGGKAVGICGSGLIDAAAVFLETGRIDARGRILGEDAVDGERVLRLTSNVYLTQNDIRELQLAKGAIAAGIDLMAQSISLATEEIQQVLLCGAFGSYMNPKSACRIGMIPAALLEKISAAGNAAGAGAKLLACNRKDLDLAQQLRDRITFLELAQLRQFRRCFSEHMRF